MTGSKPAHASATRSTFSAVRRVHCPRAPGTPLRIVARKYRHNRMPTYRAMKKSDEMVLIFRGCFDKNSFSARNHWILPPSNRGLRHWGTGFTEELGNKGYVKSIPCSLHSLPGQSNTAPLFPEEKLNCQGTSCRKNPVCPTTSICENENCPPPFVDKIRLPSL
jgi:hypothetical protein